MYRTPGRQFTLLAAVSTKHKFSLSEAVLIFCCGYDIRDVELDAFAERVPVSFHRSEAPSLDVWFLIARPCFRVSETVERFGDDRARGTNPHPIDRFPSFLVRLSIIAMAAPQVPIHGKSLPLFQAVCPIFVPFRVMVGDY